MFGFLDKLLGKKPPAEPIMVTASLPARLMPLDRGHFFDEPLDEWLKQKGLGCVEGGGSCLFEDHEIQYVDIEIDLNECSDEILDSIVELLESRGAPKGSKLIMTEGTVREFGRLEGIALSLRAENWPQEGITEEISERMMHEFYGAMTGLVNVASTREMAARVIFYAYGASFEEMKNRLEEGLAEDALLRAGDISQTA